MKDCIHQLDRWGNYCVKCHKRYLLPTNDKDGFGVPYTEWDKQRLQNMNSRTLKKRVDTPKTMR